MRVCVWEPMGAVAQLAPQGLVGLPWVFRRVKRTSGAGPTVYQSSGHFCPSSPWSVGVQEGIREIDKPRGRKTLKG